MNWDNYYSHDLLVGDANGNIHIYLSTGTNPDGTPILDGGTTVQSGGVNIDVGVRAAPIVNDWNEDGKKDLLVGSYDGSISIFYNEGTDAAPVFNSSSLLQLGGADFDIGTRSAPRIFDWDGDGLKDLLVGEFEGYAYFLENIGTNAAPEFDSAEKLLLYDGSVLDANTHSDPSVDYPRSRLFATDWNEDGFTDLLVGQKDGNVELYIAPEPLSSTLFLVGSGVLGYRGMRRKLKSIKV